MTKYVSREAAQDTLTHLLMETALNSVGYKANADELYIEIVEKRLETWISLIPAADVIPAAKAIPVEWIIKQIQEQSLGESKAFSKLLRLWEKENEE